MQDKDGDTPLIKQARNDFLQVVHYFVQQGADMEKQNNVGYTALRVAASSGRHEVVQYLVEKGEDRDNQTALMWAAWNGELRAVKTLVQNNVQCLSYMH
ncbi:hypothetical protein PHMEG_00033988 [Phytophthora megakarya]|uniref:Uncharacterized protein n=1 Tax=Phytophthora megakarya TaxID=4795 RepID=A0A225USA8_9STRA|nr:hypothetical protein PHMEG_00033988 [Phytophthora megakarya]